MLRPFVIEDAPRIAEICNDPTIADGTLRVPYPYTQSDAEAWLGMIAQWHNGGQAVVLAMTMKAGGLVVGAIGLELTPAHHRGELGYWIARTHRGQGLTTEASIAMIEYGFEALGLHRISCGHFPRNAASGRVMQKAGMTYEGVLRGHFCKGDGYEDSVNYGILRTDPRQTFAEQA